MHHTGHVWQDEIPPERKKPHGKRFPMGYYFPGGLGAEALPFGPQAQGRVGNEEYPLRTGMMVGVGHLGSDLEVRSYFTDLAVRQ
jgi:hypothetical protein